MDRGTDAPRQAGRQKEAEADTALCDGHGFVQQVRNL